MANDQVSETERDLVAADALAWIRRELHADVQPEHVWVIGDTPHDVQCARAIGARAVAVATGFFTVEQLRQCEPDLAVADLTDRTALYRAWGMAD